MFIKNDGRNSSFTVLRFHTYELLNACFAVASFFVGLGFVWASLYLSSPVSTVSCDVFDSRHVDDVVLF